ncbi:MAG: DUF167 family protein [Minisyncoccia bacterium]
MGYIHVKVTAGARKEWIKPVRSKASGQESEDHFDVAVRQKAERNMANTRVVELVAEYFSTPVSNVRIVNGHRHPSKLLLIEDK